MRRNDQKRPTVKDSRKEDKWGQQGAEAAKGCGLQVDRRRKEHIII